MQFNTRAMKLDHIYIGYCRPPHWIGIAVVNADLLCFRFISFEHRYRESDVLFTFSRDFRLIECEWPYWCSCEICPQTNTITSVVRWNLIWQRLHNCDAVTMHTYSCLQLLREIRREKQVRRRLCTECCWTNSEDVISNTYVFSKMVFFGRTHYFSGN